MLVVLGRARYIHRKTKNTGIHGGRSGDTSILYIPVAVMKHLGIKDKDLLEFWLTDDSHIEIHKARLDPRKT